MIIHHSPKTAITFKKSELTKDSLETASKIYPAIKYVANPEREIICEYQIPSKHRPIHYLNPCAQLYFKAVCKIFSELSNINVKDLWICEKINTIYPVIVYFTEAVQYPTLDCCLQPVLFEFVDWLSGSVKCSKCSKLAFSFVHVNQAEDRENNRENQRRNNEKVYKEFKQSRENKRENVRKLISSNQHRHRNLRKIVNIDLNRGLNSVFVNRNRLTDSEDGGTKSMFFQSRQFDDNKVYQSQSISKLILNKTNGWNESVFKNTEIEFDHASIKIGEFIIEIEDKDESESLLKEEKNEKGKDNYRLSEGNWIKVENHLGATCQEIKDIIEEIFL